MRDVPLFNRVFRNSLQLAAIWLLAFGLAQSSVAQESTRNPANTAPTAGIDQVARKVDDLGYSRTRLQDSTLSGAAGSGLPASTITIPIIEACTVNPSAIGCSGYCTANPSALGCPGYCLANPAAAGCGGSGGGVLPPTDPVAGVCPAGQTLRGYFWEDTGLEDDVGWCNPQGPVPNFPVAGVIGASCNRSTDVVGHGPGRCTSRGYVMPNIACKARCN